MSRRSVDGWGGQEGGGGWIRLVRVRVWGQYGMGTPAKRRRTGSGGEQQEDGLGSGQGAGSRSAVARKSAECKTNAPTQEYNEGDVRDGEGDTASPDRCRLSRAG